MAICSYIPCQFPALPGKQRCILHEDTENKDRDLFVETLQEYIEKSLEKSPGEVCFDTISFPRIFLLAYHINANPKIQQVNINTCKFGDSLNLSGLRVETLNLSNNLCPKFKIENSEIGHLKLVDNYFNSIEISNSKISQLTFITYKVPGIESPKMNSVFLILNKIDLVEIYHVHIIFLHISISSLQECRILDLENSEEVLIRDTAFLGLATFQELRPLKYFALCRCRILNPKLFSIMQSDLFHAGFKSTDVSEVTFIDNQWRRKNQRHIHILDELVATCSQKADKVQGPYGQVTLNQVAETYRQLKINFERKGNYIDAGDFHYGEMEMRRLSVPSPFRITSIYSIYKLLGEYGESPLYAFLILAGVFVSLVFLHTLTGFYVNGLYVGYDLNLFRFFEFPSLLELSNVVKLIFGNLTLRTLDSPKLAMNFSNTLLWIFETIFGPLQIGLLALSIKRKLRR